MKRERLWGLFAELAAGLISLVSLGRVYCFLLDMANNDALYFRASLSVLNHKPSALAAELATHI